MYPSVARRPRQPLASQGRAAKGTSRRRKGPCAPLVASTCPGRARAAAARRSFYRPPVLHHPSYRLLGFALVLGVSLLRASSARADEARLRVVTEGSLAEADCLDTDRLALRVRALRSAGLTLGTGQGEANLTLDVSFARQPDGTLRASLTAGAPIAGERVLFDKGAGCAALSEAVAVTVALLLDGAFFVASDATRRPVGTSDEAAEGVSARSASGQLLAAVGLTDGTVAELAPRFGLELVAHPTGRVNDRALELGFAFGYVVGGKSPLGLGSVRSAAAFGVGMLSQEREALTIEALAASGRGAEARARADAFLARYPRSAFSASISRLSTK